MAPVRLLTALSADKRAEFAQKFIQRFIDPAFGSMSKAEIELLVFSLLHEIGAMEEANTQYEVARALRITPSRVRSLKMQMRLRDVRQTDDVLRQRIVECLSRSRFLKQGAAIEFGIEDPLVREDAVARLKLLGATADSSFNQELVRIQLEAFVDFIEQLLPPDRHELVRKALIKAGMEDTSLKGVLLGALGKLASKAAGAAGEQAAKQAAELAAPALKDLFGSAAGALTNRWKSILKLEGNDGDQIKV